MVKAEISLLVSSLPRASAEWMRPSSDGRQYLVESRPNESVGPGLALGCISHTPSNRVPPPQIGFFEPAGVVRDILAEPTREAIPLAVVTGRLERPAQFPHGPIELGLIRHH